jgi:hypothetical protein
MQKKVNTLRLNLSLCASHQIGELYLIAFLSLLSIAICYSRVLHSAEAVFDELINSSKLHFALLTLYCTPLDTESSELLLQKCICSKRSLLLQFLFTVINRKLLGFRPDPG